MARDTAGSSPPDELALAWLRAMLASEEVASNGDAAGNDRGITKALPTGLTSAGLAFRRKEHANDTTRK